MFAICFFVGIIVCCLVSIVLEARRAKRLRAAAAEEAARRDAAKQAEKDARDAAKQAEKDAHDAEKARRQAEAERRRAERLEAARLLAEYRERELRAARELREMQRQPAAEADDPAPTPAAETMTPVMTPEQFAERFGHAQDDNGQTGEAPAAEAAQPAAAQNYAGEVVAFTGTLPGMTRREAIAAVQTHGGRAFDTMPAGTTILVIGDTGGNSTRKLEKADKWISQVRKITAAQFLASLTAE